MAALSTKASGFQRLVDQIAQLQDPKAKQVVLMAYLRGELAEDPDKLQDYTLLRSLPDGRIESLHSSGNADDESTNNLLDLLEKHGIHWHDMVIALAAVAEKPLERLPCANVEPKKNWRCQESGRLACSECKLVSYCSKVRFRFFLVFFVPRLMSILGMPTKSLAYTQTRWARFVH
jgi:hypothetical protein